MPTISGVSMVPITWPALTIDSTVASSFTMRPENWERTGVTLLPLNAIFPGTVTSVCMECFCTTSTATAARCSGESVIAEVSEAVVVSVLVEGVVRRFKRYRATVIAMRQLRQQAQTRCRLFFAVKPDFGDRAFVIQSS